MTATKFEITQDGGVRAVDAQTGSVLARLSASGTTVVELVPFGSGVVVREDYYQFPRASSNLYYLDATPP